MTIILKTQNNHPEYGRYWRSDKTGIIYDYIASMDNDEGVHQEYTEVTLEVDSGGGIIFEELK